MMTPRDEQKLLDATAKVIEAELGLAFKRLLDLIRGGAAPRDAVAKVLKGFRGAYAQDLAAGFSKILKESIGAKSVLEMDVAGVSLSKRLYKESRATSAVVTGIVSRHAKGWHSARNLTLKIFEGYGFKDKEALNLSPRNQKLPKYLRDELLTDPGVQGELTRHFSRARALRVKTPALKAAYLEYLDAIEQGAGQELLRKKLNTAFYERMRYFSNRIAQTELHRAYADMQAREVMADDEVRYVQYRMSRTHPRMDICDLFAKRDLYGLGPGVYPKEACPKAPAHPHCRCVCAPRLDIHDAAAVTRDPDASRAYLRSLDEQQAAQVMGSKARRDAVLNGADPLDVWNSSSDPMYRVRLVGDVARGGTPGLGAGAMSDQKLARDVMPNADEPIIPDAKLSKYLLNPDHPRGADKARVYKAALGFGQEDAALLSESLRTGLASGVWVKSDSVDYGVEHTVDIAITGKNGYVKTVRSRWAYDNGSEFPRLITAIVRSKKNE